MVDSNSTATGSTATGPAGTPVEGGKSPVPAISVPKGGGAIRGIGEKFAANPVTGTGSMSVPIATSAGRSGFGPQLALSYDSGSGNGPFGFGWNLSVPAITRKTDKGLPQYRDADESDVFILSGAEDLVPMLQPDGTHFEDIDTAPGYLIHRYRPRIEGLFARIERWTGPGNGDVHWRCLSKDNVLSVYGNDANSRIFDPGEPRRIFTWLLCETRDDKGNAVLYEYKREDGTGVDLTQAHERNRGGGDDPRRAANRYLKRVVYGNRVPLLDDEGQRPRVLTDAQIRDAGWMFEVVFDYGEHDADNPGPRDGGPWIYRFDPFSTYRPGFEVRTGRLCRRVLMFHHFKGEAGVGTDCLVRSTDFTYSSEQEPGSARNRIYTFLSKVAQTGYRRNNGGYLKRSLPPVEFGYTKPLVQDTVQDVDAESLQNLPVGLDGAIYQWTDLHGEGIPGILTEQGGAWLYKRNLSPLNPKPGTGAAGAEVQFSPLEVVAATPSLRLGEGQSQFMDLAGDGQPDLVTLDGPLPGLYEHDDAEGWQPFRPFTARLARDMRDPNLRLVDLTGDGHADVLISEDDTFIWHASLAEEGFAPAHRVGQAPDEEHGPRLVFADGTQSIYLADLSGDGLTDLVRIRNGEVCYWPNLGYGHFGAKVTMDRAPLFDNPDQFDHRRLRLADIDGSGTTDLLYLHRDGVRLWFNQSGNSWSPPQPLNVFPRVDDVVAVTTLDLLGNGTACLVWSSPLPGDAGRQMRYVPLMGSQKPHLLVSVTNNLGAETRVQYTSSTTFYLRDKDQGKPWVTRLPFPVHVVERVQTHDRISRNRFVTRYAYHHGYFDGEEREFRGFGMVEQYDTEEIAALTASGALAQATNVDAASHVPPVLTRTWFHTGLDFGRDHISDYFAGLLDEDDPGEYYREPGLTDDQARRLLLPDTVMPPGLTLAEEREACRSLKGSMLRQEVYALDGTAKASIPYTVTEQNFTINPLQQRGPNRHAVFFAHAREAISYHYERNPADPRMAHTMSLEVDPYGNVLKQLAIAYGRRTPSTDPVLTGDDHAKQTRLLITVTENAFTTPVALGDDHRTPLPAETRTFEVTGFTPENNALRFSFDEWTRDGFALLASAAVIPYEQAASGTAKQKRLIEHVRTLYRRDDLTGLLPLHDLEPLALPGDNYQLALTPALITSVFIRPRPGQPDENLVPDPALLLEGTGGDQGGYVAWDGNWWVPSGTVFFDPAADVAVPATTATQERQTARRHFHLPRKAADPFHHSTTVAYDTHDLLVARTLDPVGNTLTAINNYRVLQPHQVIDPNANHTDLAFDTLGMLVGTAVRGKMVTADRSESGDSLQGFTADLTAAQVAAFVATPKTTAVELLAGATTRIVYDLDRYHATGKPDEPPYAATLARERHVGSVPAGETSPIQVSFSYSDGFGREIQKKVQAEPGPVPRRDTHGVIIVGADGQPEMTVTEVSPRWVGSGWTVRNNKGKPVRQYEPFFSDAHRFEFDVRMGVSPVLFYDPVGRVIATLHPNHTYDKVVFDPWRQVSYDVNDTVAPHDPQTGEDPQTGDPRTDPDIRGYVAPYFATQPTTWQTWHAQRQAGALGTQEQAAATKAAAHANTPTTAHLDTLGRPFLTTAHNRLEHNGVTVDETYATRVELDIEDDQRAVRDAIVQNGDEHGRIVMRYDHDMLGNRTRQRSMEAGQRWMLNDVTGNPIRAWDSRDHTLRTDYDPLRRPLRTFITGADPHNPTQELVTERLVYGEQHPDAAARNLRGQLYLHLDQAGAATNEAHDFNGNLLRASRHLGRQYTQTVDWRAVDANHRALPPDPTAKLDPLALDTALATLLDDDTFTSNTTYDALNRPTLLTTPHTPAMAPSLIRPEYNEANLLKSVDANLRGDTTAGQPVWTPFVTDIDYDAKGQRTLIEYGSGAAPNRHGVRTTYTYDRLTLRLTHLLTERNPATFPDDCPDPPPAGWPGCQIQNLHYTYDPAGNITHLRDHAQQILYFRNKRIEPTAEYTYDATYRLTEATGREHLGQTGGAPIPHSHNDAGRVGITWASNDGNAMGTYIEQYAYDAVGNIHQMQHSGTDPAHAGWVRTYDYHEPSLIEPGKQSNRLSQTTLGTTDPNPTVEPYSHDAHGNMIRMPHLGGGQPDPNMHWNYRDQLRQADLGGGGTAYYTYDAGGQRVRKVWEKAPGLTEERIYLSGFEIFRQRNGVGQITLEREALHITDDKQHIALVETRTTDLAGNDPAPLQLIRYQFSNHLGSVSLELDAQAHIISYEEYTPYGSTSYQAVRSQTETPKRCRYTCKERDEETGFYYHGLRYCASWLGRWTSADPHDLEGGLNLYAYGASNPLIFVDPSGTAPQTHEDQRATDTAAKKNETLSKSSEVQIEARKAELRETFQAREISARAHGGTLENGPPAEFYSERDRKIDQPPLGGPFLTGWKMGGLFSGETITGHKVDRRKLSREISLRLIEHVADIHALANLPTTIMGAYRSVAGTAKTFLGPISANAKMEAAIVQLNQEAVTVYKLTPVKELSQVMWFDAFVTTDRAVLGKSLSVAGGRLDVLGPPGLATRYGKDPIGNVMVEAQTTWGNLRLPKPVLGDVPKWRSSMPSMPGLTGAVKPNAPIVELQLNETVTIMRQATKPVLK